MRNLRVTLTYLLDVIDPDRQKGSGSTFIDERDGQFRFARDPTVRIDLRRRNTIAAAIVHAGEVGAEREVVATARELTREPAGPLVGGTPLGDWVEPHRQRASELLLRAISVAGPLALRIGDHDLAEQLGEIGIRDDPWGERLHVLVVRARFARDDLDGARRALRRAFEALHDLGVRPERATINLARELGVTTTS
jgi:DNA-binding SARP family transcriptional activator